MSDEEFEYEYDDDADYGSGNDAEDAGDDDVSIQIANSFYEADGMRGPGSHAYTVHFERAFVVFYAITHSIPAGAVAIWLPSLCTRLVAMQPRFLNVACRDVIIGKFLKVFFFLPRRHQAAGPCECDQGVQLCGDAGKGARPRDGMVPFRLFAM